MSSEMAIMPMATKLLRLETQIRRIASWKKYASEEEGMLVSSSCDKVINSLPVHEHRVLAIRRTLGGGGLLLDDMPVIEGDHAPVAALDQIAIVRCQQNRRSAQISVRKN